MLVVTVNRTIAFVQCRHPNFYTEIKFKYQCDQTKKQWKLIFQNKNFTCREFRQRSSLIDPFAFSPLASYEIPPLAKSLTTSTSTTTMRPALGRCSESDFNALIGQLPTQSRYLSHRDSPSSASNYFDRRVTCSFNQSIHLTYRCDQNDQRWTYVYGSSRAFRRCYPPCSDEERKELFEKYFSPEERKFLRPIRRGNRPFLRLRCSNAGKNRLKAVVYRCGTLSLTSSQWFQLHSCSQDEPIEAPLPGKSELFNVDQRSIFDVVVVVVSLSIDSAPRVCPPVVPPGSACQYERGEFISDTRGCARKVCPHLSPLCQVTHFDEDSKSGTRAERTFL